MIDGADTEYNHKPRALLVADAPGERAAREAIDFAGAQVMLHSGWNTAIETSGRPLAADLFVIEASGIADDALDDALPIIALHARDRQARIVASCDVMQIDLVSTHLFGRHVQLLCAPSMADRIAALAIAGSLRAEARVGEAGRDAEAVRLRRLNEEVARIAETLARLTREDGGMPDRPVPSVGDRHGGYGAPPVAGGVTASDIRQAIRARRLRAQFFEDGLFEDPAWDMLLDLHAAELERAQVSVSSLCIAAAVAPTTALRWIAKMTEAGLFERHPDPFDRRRAFMALSAKARDGMQGYFAAMRRAGLSIA